MKRALLTLCLLLATAAPALADSFHVDPLDQQVQVQVQGPKLTWPGGTLTLSNPRQIGEQLNPRLDTDGDGVPDPLPGDKCPTVAGTGTDGCPVSTPPPPSAHLLSDSFDAPNGCNGLVTNEYAAWHASDTTAVRSSVWRSDGGSLFSTGGLASTGSLDNTAADRCSTTATHSDKMRFWTRQSGFGDVTVTAKLRPQAWGAGVPASWGGFKFYLRRQLDVTDSGFYTAEPYIYDGHVFIQKKCPDLTYHLLAQRSGFAVPLGAWHTVAASSRTNADGSVTISLYRDGALALETTDTGTGCPPLGPGRVGFRSDFLQWQLDDFTVDGL